MVPAQVKLLWPKIYSLNSLIHPVCLPLTTTTMTLSEMPASARSRVNYDHPDSLDTHLFVTHLEALSKGISVEVPIYDFATHTRPGGTHQLQPADVVIVDGVLLLALPECREFLDLTVFVDAPEEIRLERRLERDVFERGRDESRRSKPVHNERLADASTSGRTKPTVCRSCCVSPISNR